MEGDFIGTNASGTGTLLYQVAGVYVQSSDNTIGGPTAAYGNLVSGNQHDGVMIANIGIELANNAIGTNIAGNGPVPNGGSGVNVPGTSNAPAASAAADRDTISYNLISDNAGDGIILDFNASDVLVQGNTIGTDVHGTIAQPNANGVEVSGVEGNTIGGSVSGLGNTISGNSNGSGIYILNGGTTGNTVEGNLIGTTANGQGALGNAVGITISNSPDNLIGGPTPMAGTGVGNVITGNTSAGIEISNDSSGNLIAGNLLGLYVGGTQFFSEPHMLTTGMPMGIVIDDSPGNTIGVAIAAAGSIVGAGDVIAGFARGDRDLRLHATGNPVEGDQIGTDPSRNVIEGSIGIGVYIDDVASNTVGGSTPGAGNNIVGYTTMASSSTARWRPNNVVQGNRIGPAGRWGRGSSPGSPSTTLRIMCWGARHWRTATPSRATPTQASTSSAGSSASGNDIDNNHLEHNGYGILLYNATNNGGYGRS